MGHIILKIRKGDTEKPYIVVDADYLQEAWVAEAYDNNKTKIIKQFHCKKFNNCFGDLKRCIRGLGEVTAISADGIQNNQIEQLKAILANDSDTKMEPENGHRRNLHFNTKKKWEQIQKYGMRLMHS